MSIHRTRPAHYEEYREFFSILASGDRSQYNRAQHVLTPPRCTNPGTVSTCPVQLQPELVYDYSDDSDGSSDTAVEIIKIDGVKESSEALEISVEETPRFLTQHSSPSESTLNVETAEALELHLTSPLAAQTTILSSNSSLAELGSSASAVATTHEELLLKLKQTLRDLYDIETFRGLVREVLKESEEAYRPLAEGDTLTSVRPSIEDNARPVTEELIFKSFGDAPVAHIPKKRYLMQSAPQGASRTADEKSAFKNAQLLMDVVSDMMSSHRTSFGWRKLREHLGEVQRSRPKAIDTKKRVHTELDE